MVQICDKCSDMKVFVHWELNQNPIRIISYGSCHLLAFVFQIQTSDLEWKDIISHYQSMHTFIFPALGVLTGLIFLCYKVLLEILPKCVKMQDAKLG